MLGQTGHGLWSRDTPLGESGYFSDVAYDLTQTSFHVLTTEGIHGRDTVDSGGVALPSKRRLTGQPSAGSAR